MATIVINRSESYCANCPPEKRAAWPREPGHLTVLGYTHNGEPGCGEPWTAVASDYIGNRFDNIAEHYFGFENLRGLPVLKYGEPR